MQTTRFALVLVTVALLQVGTAHADKNISINFFGLHYERHTTTTPSLKLIVETNGPTISGRWTAELADSKPGRGCSIWVPVIVAQDKAETHYGKMSDGKDRLGFLFAEAKTWPGNVVIDAPAGALHLTGTATKDKLAGRFSFDPYTNYVAEASKLLVAAPSVLELFSLALHEISIEGIREYAAAGLKLRANDLLRLKNSGVPPDYCTAVRKVRPFSIEEIVRLRNAGVDSAFPQQLRDGGYDFDAEQMVRLRNAGVSADFARAWKDAGFNYDAESLVRMRNGGVPADLGKAVHAAFPSATGEQIVRLRNAGISGDFTSEMHRADKRITIEEMVRLRNAGVSPDYVKSWREAGYSYGVEEIVRLRNAGVPSDYAAATIVPGRKPLSSETLIRLRNRGVSAQEIRELRE